MKLVSIFTAAVFLIGCGKVVPPAPTPTAWLPGDTSLVALGAPPAPPDNPTTPDKVELGKLLYFDPRTAGDQSMPCASCHLPEQGWATNTDISPGYPGNAHWRNSQTIVNTAYLNKLFWAGEVTSLEAQANSAITGNLAGNGDPTMIEERLYQVPVYRALFKKVFGSDVPSYEQLLKAIAAFERTIVTKDLPYDRYLGGDQNALSPEAKRGLEIFRGKGNCVSCHNGMMLTNENFHNLGVPENPIFKKDPLSQIALRFQHYSRGTTDEVYKAAHRDEGLFYTTKIDDHRGRFRTPPLRYIDHTMPFMHNGVLGTLEDVVDFYDKGGGDDARKDPLIVPLGLTADEKAALVIFLREGLTGPEILMEAPTLPKDEVIQ